MPFGYAMYCLGFGYTMYCLDLSLYNILFRFWLYNDIYTACIGLKAPLSMKCSTII